MDGNHARALLGVPENASIAHIRHGFRRAVLVAHPDHGGCADRFEELLAARDLLMAETAEKATTVAPTVPSAYDRAWRGPRRPSFRVADVRRRDRVVASEPAPRPEFASILASVLAGAASVSAA